MKLLYHFQVNPSFSLENAWEELENSGVELAYGSEEEEAVSIFGYWDSDQPLPLFSSIAEARPSTLPSIDWDSQWAMHGLNFHDGYVHVDLALFGSISQVLRLEPGPGFGDVSHPTTRLVLRLMANYIKHTTVVDIGSGSGVLTLAAVAMGAPSAYGIDIDPAALEHAYTNAKTNQMENQCHFCLPTDLVVLDAQPIVVVMNMIMSEQQEAWSMLPQLQDTFGFCLTSGIRQEEREQYLEQARQWNWELIEEIEEGIWKGFAFKRAMQV